MLKLLRFATEVSTARLSWMWVAFVWLMPFAGTHAHGSAGSIAAEGSQWLSYGKEATQQRYSPLGSINRGTLSRLGLEWKLDLPAETSLVSTPLMVAGSLYFTGKFSVVYAVDAHTGKLKWTFDPRAREELAKSSRRMTYNWGINRGVAYWKGTILVGAADGRLISLCARTGLPRWSTNTIDPSVAYLSITSAPLVFRDTVLIGNAGGDYGASRGYVTAYSAATGKELWRTFTIPADPAQGFESDAMKMAAGTWGPQWWKTAGGGNVWNAMTYDPDYHRVYLGTGNGSPWNQHVPGRAGGDNLFVASIVALDADSGKYVWHYQVVPGDAWDYDATEDLVLADVDIGQVKTPVLMQASKDGFFYVINRATGKLISAQKFAHVTWADRVDLTSGRPVEAPNMRPGDAASAVVILWPWLNGAHSWPPMSFNPKTGLVYIPGVDARQVFDARGIDPSTYKADRAEGWTGYSDLIGRNTSATMTPAADATEDRAWLEAWNPRTNKIAWKASQPGLWSGGTLTTGGNLVFIGRADGRLAAYDAQTGAQLWTFDCGRPITAPPISYALNGIQYIAVLVGWGGVPAIEGAMSNPGGIRMTYRDGGRGLFAFALNGTASASVPPVGKVVPIDVPDFRPEMGKVRRGEHLFDNNCNNCHGTDALSGGAAPDLRASALAADRKALRDVVLAGKLLLRGMPQYVDFNDDDVDALYHYIRWRAREDLSCVHGQVGGQCVDN